MSPGASGTDDEQQALLGALRAVLAPLAQLAVARGVPYALIEETLKACVVQAAAAAHPGVVPHRSVSRIATATGINRREVTRLVADLAQRRAPARGRSLANEVYTHWLSSPAYRGGNGRPLPLPRLGPAPSFEALAQAVTRDVHPRSLLDELLRLELADFDEAADTVSLRGDGFVPSGDRVRLLGFLADNVGDHLNGAVDNVLDAQRGHFEQAIFADGLSEAAVDEVRALIAPQWKLLLQALVPPMEAMVERDADIPPAEQRRVRIGLFAYDEPTADAKAAGAAPKSAAQAPRRPALRRPRKT